MTALKGRDIAKFIKQGLNKPACVLIYGSNQGRVEQYARQLMTNYFGGDIPADSLIRLDADDIQSNPGLLYDQANASSLFKDKILVRVRGNIKNPQKSLTTILKEPPANPVIIQAENLSTNSALRKLFEKSKSGFALPCYDPDLKEVKVYIQDLLRQKSKSITPEALSMLLKDIHFDLGYVKGEIDKLILYIGDSQVIDINHIFSISSNMKDTDISALADAVGNGDMAKFEYEFDRYVQSGNMINNVHILVQNHFHLLLQLRLMMDEKRQDAIEVVKAHKPVIFFKRQDIIARQLSRWTQDDLRKALDKIQASILFTRQHPQLELSHTGMTYLSLCAVAARY